MTARLNQAGVKPASDIQELLDMMEAANRGGFYLSNLSYFSAYIFVPLLFALGIWTGYKILFWDKQRLQEETKKFHEIEGGPH